MGISTRKGNILGNPLETCSGIWEQLGAPRQPLPSGFFTPIWAPHPSPWSCRGSARLICPPARSTPSPWSFSGTLLPSSIWDPRNTAGGEADLALPCLPGPIHLEQLSLPKKPAKGLRNLFPRLRVWFMGQSWRWHRPRREEIYFQGFHLSHASFLQQSCGTEPWPPCHNAASRSLGFSELNSFTSVCWEFTRNDTETHPAAGIPAFPMEGTRRERPQQNSVWWGTPKAKGFPVGK